MIDDLSRTRSIATGRDTVLVIGAGAAGLALTRCLARAGHDVVLLESGPDVAVSATGNPDAADLNVGTVTGLDYTGLELGRARVIGGAAQLWHGQCMRLHEIDVQQRDWVAGSGWPIPMGELAEHYPAAEEWLGVGALGYGADRWHEHPRLEPLEWDARHLLHDFTEYTSRPLLGSVHRADLAADPHCRVYVNATVTRIRHDGADPSRGRVTGVEVATPDGRRRDIDARHVVLCGGAIENARLLQLSDPLGVGLGVGRDEVGRYLQDHPVITTAEVESTDHRVLQDRYIVLHRGRRRLFPKVRLAPAAQRAHQLLDATAVFLHEHDQPGPAAARRLVLAARARRVPERPVHELRTALSSPAPVIRDTFRRYVRGLATGTRPSRVLLQLWLEQEPDPDSRLTLGAGTDALGLRRAQVHWRIGDRELETSRQMTRWIGADLERLGVARLHPTDAMHDDDAWRAWVRDAFHPAGTTRMSLDPFRGVVDADLQVHGMRGLHVVGGSVFPVAGYANPTLTIVALALRLADRLSVQIGEGESLVSGPRGVGRPTPAGRRAHRY